MSYTRTSFQQEEKKAEYVAKKQVNSDENLTTSQLAKIEAKRKAKEEKAKEKAKSKALKNGELTLGVGSTSVRRFCLKTFSRSNCLKLDPFDVRTESFIKFCQTLLDNLNRG